MFAHVLDQKIYMRIPRTEINSTKNEFDHSEHSKQMTPIRRRFRRTLMICRDALSPQNIELSPEFPDFPDFELRGPERSQKSGISCFLH